MDTRVESINRALKNHDSDLFCKKESHGVNVYRRNTAWEEFWLDGSRFLYSRPSPQFILCLTDTWTVKGKPVEWGIEPIINRIKSIDSASSFNEVNNLVANLEKAEETKEKDRKNKFESMAYEMRGVYKKAFSDINTSSLEKIDRRRNNNGSRK